MRSPKSAVLASGAPPRAVGSRKPDRGLASWAPGTRTPACALRLPRGVRDLPCGPACGPRPLALLPLLSGTLWCFYFFEWEGQVKWLSCRSE